MLNKPLLIIRLMIYLFIYFNIKKCITPVVLSLEGNSGGAKKKKKTVSATNLRITDCASKNNVKIHKKSLFKASSRAAF